MGMVGPAPLQKCVGDLCCAKSGGFCRGFSWRIFWALFHTKMRRKTPAAQKPRKKPAAQKEKSARNPFCQTSVLRIAMFKRTFARTLPDNLSPAHMKMWGFKGRRARKFTRTLPRTSPWNFITMLSMPLKEGFFEGVLQWVLEGRSQV